MMKKFRVKLLNRIFNKVVIVEASYFSKHLLAGNVVFKDTDDNMVALFDWYDIDYITTLNNEEGVENEDK